jgi:hypothetical protein
LLFERNQAQYAALTLILPSCHFHLGLPPWKVPKCPKVRYQRRGERHGNAWQHFAWSLLIGSAVFGISHLIVGEFVSAGIAFVITMVVLFQWRQTRAWIGSTNPNLVFVATGLAVFAIIVSPFIEQHRWPFSSPITANNLSLVAPLTTTGATPSINLEQNKENEIVKKVNSLSPGDKERLSTALFQLSSVLDSSETTHDILWQIKTAKPMTPAVLIPKLDELKIAASSLSSRIYAEINQRYFQEVMTQITEVPASSDATEQSLTLLLSTLGTIADEYEKYLRVIETTAALLKPENERFEKYASDVESQIAWSRHLLMR